MNRTDDIEINHEKYTVYNDLKCLPSVNDLKELFDSVGWVSAKHPEKLQKAVEGSTFVITVWKGQRLVGLLTAIDDSSINVFLSYLLVNSEYQNKGLGKYMMSEFAKKYKHFREILTTENETRTFYERFGFIKNGIAMFNTQGFDSLG